MEEDRERNTAKLNISTTTKSQIFYSLPKKKKTRYIYMRGPVSHHKSSLPCCKNFSTKIQISDYPNDSHIRTYVLLLGIAKFLL